MSQESSPIRTMILKYVGFKPEFEPTHGGCPPQYRTFSITGLDQAEAALNTYVEERCKKAREDGIAAYAKAYKETISQLEAKHE